MIAYEVDEKVEAIKDYERRIREIRQDKRLSKNDRKSFVRVVLSALEAERNDPEEMP